MTFEVQRVEIVGPLVSGKETPAKVHGLLTIKQKAVPKVADATVPYMKLTPKQVEQQLLFLKVNNQLELNADLVFVKE